MRFTKTLLTTALLGASIFSFQSTAWADTPEQQFQQGLTAYEQSDYQTAFKLWLPMADGRGVKQDGVEAVKWFRKAAEQGNAEAQNGLGMMYKGRLGVKQDYFKAVKWYRKAAEQGHGGAQVMLGFSYLSGEGVQVNKSLAKEWFGKACDNGEQVGCEYYGKLNRGER
ncbi:tetratricopeptide repeat protein [Haemophilus influenzae]|uniref:tetratricopeptide repeat protein n=1 Tax=Haemophilus influenzae TaxID=727 RepID=UPI00143346B3|nr:tetratricopeptide repeat protein [Haemophilus influenzae]NKB84993.1 sel1 repeat family protein [Haemophilus influenzae]